MPADFRNVAGFMPCAEMTARMYCSLVAAYPDRSGCGRAKSKRAVGSPKAASVSGPVSMFSASPALTPETYIWL